MNRFIGLAAVVGLAMLASPASAATLFSISGVVGDANFGCYTNECELFDRLNFQNEGLVEITYSGPAIISSSDQAVGLFTFDYYGCNSPEGCPTGNLSYHGGDDDPLRTFYAHTGVSSYSEVVDSTAYLSTNLNPEWVPVASTADPYPGHGGTTPFPPLCCQGAMFNVYRRQMTGYDVDDWVSADDIGQPYSLIVSTVPEPATWAMFLLGFGAVGFAMRRKKDIGVAA